MESSAMQNLLLSTQTAHLVCILGGYLLELQEWLLKFINWTLKGLQTPVTCYKETPPESHFW